MRICLISREYPPDTGWGGIATFTRHLAYGLKELGHDVQVVTLAKGLARLENDGGIPVHRVLMHEFPGHIRMMNLCMPYTRHLLTTTVALWQKFHELQSQQPFDVVDTPELLADGLFPGLTKAAPLVTRLYTPHSKFIAERLHNITASFDHQFLSMLERIAMLASDVLTSPSKDLAEFVAADLNYPLEDIRIVHNPIDTDEFSPEGDMAFTSEDSLSVLFVGRLEERKGIHYLLEAVPDIIRECPSVRFVIIGSDTRTATGHTSVLAELQSNLRRSGCADHVKFISRVPLEQLPTYYRAADICIVPSVYDNSPYTCLEAMSCGRAVIGTTGGGMPEYLGDENEGILVPPRDSGAIAAAIVKLAKDESLRKELGKNARMRVLSRFKRTEIARLTTELYEEAIERYLAKPRTALYLRDHRRCVVDTELFMYAFSRNIADFLRLHSFRARIEYYWSLRLRPRLFAAKSFAVAVESLLKLIGRRAMPQWLVEFKDRIDLYEHPVHTIVSQTEWQKPPDFSGSPDRSAPEEVAREETGARTNR